MTRVGVVQVETAGFWSTTLSRGQGAAGGAGVTNWWQVAQGQWCTTKDLMGQVAMAPCRMKSIMVTAVQASTSIAPVGEHVYIRGYEGVAHRAI